MGQLVTHVGECRRMALVPVAMEVLPDEVKYCSNGAEVVILFDVELEGVFAHTRILPRQG